jgi:hypothetical protein
VLPRSVRLAWFAVLAAALISAIDGLVNIVAIQHLNPAADAYLHTTDDTGRALRLITDVRTSLWYNLGLTVVATVVLGLVATMIRRPSWRIRIAALVAAGAFGIALLCGMAAGPDVSVASARGDSHQVQATITNLLVGWYTVGHGLAVVALVGALVAMTVQLLRTTSADFYRPIRGYAGWGRGPGEIELDPDHRNADPL